MKKNHSCVFVRRNENHRIIIMAFKSQKTASKIFIICLAKKYSKKICKKIRKKYFFKFSRICFLIVKNFHRALHIFGIASTMVSKIYFFPTISYGCKKEGQEEDREEEGQEAQIVCLLKRHEVFSNDVAFFLCLMSGRNAE